MKFKPFPELQRSIPHNRLQIARAIFIRGSIMCFIVRCPFFLYFFCFFSQKNEKQQIKCEKKQAGGLWIVTENICKNDKNNYTLRKIMALTFGHMWWHLFMSYGLSLIILFYVFIDSYGQSMFVRFFDFFFSVFCFFLHLNSNEN